MNGNDKQGAQPATTTVAAQEAVAYWKVTFRMYHDDTELCVLFVDGPDRPTLDNIDVTPRPLELVSVEPRFVKQHRWDQYGERCLDCGDKDWMDDPVCRPRFAEASIEVTPDTTVTPSSDVTPRSEAAPVAAAPGIDGGLREMLEGWKNSDYPFSYEGQCAQKALNACIADVEGLLIDASPTALGIDHAEMVKSNLSSIKRLATVLPISHVSAANIVDEANHAIALIDAIPKGGSDEWQATDAEIAAWVARNDLGSSFGSKTDARCAFEDARSAEQATSTEVGE